MKESILTGKEIPSKVTKEVIVSLLSSPWSIIPIVAGVTDLLALWALSISSGIAAFAGVAGILGGIGVFVTRFFTGSDGINKEVLKHLEQDADKKREKALDDLDAKLSVDQDPRTEACLRDLRAMIKVCKEDQTWTVNLDPRSAFDIVSGVGQLFKGCVSTLEKTLSLWQTAQKMATPEARKPILEERERMIGEVTQSISQFGGLLARIQSLGIKSSSSIDSQGSELAQIRSQLDQSLEVAKMVQERMNTLNKEIGVTSSSDYT
ncbi:MAG: hypothetical protein V1753_11100 [Pseudomonadota bacterium]